MAAALLAAGSAAAVLPPITLFSTRYAAPAGSNDTSNDCKDAQNPCSLERALAVAQNADQVVLSPGDYVSVDGWDVTKRVNIHGAKGQPRPRLFAAGVSSRALEIAANGTHAWNLYLRSDGHNGHALDVAADGTLIEQVVAETVNEATIACAMVGATGTIRDSVCRHTGTGSAVAALFFGGVAPQSSYTVRNVDAVNDSLTDGSTGLLASPNCSGCETGVTVINSILRGTSQDASAAAVPGSAAGVTISYSNFDPAKTSAAAPDEVTDAGHNQTTAPLFADAANGDFHQLAGSPTIDAGSTDDANNGAEDFDFGARTLGVATDIGADEYVPPGTPPGGGGGGADTTPPAFLAATVHKTKRGFRFDYTLSEDALVKFKIERLRRRHGHKRWVHVVTLAQRGLAGGNVKRWNAKVHRHRVPAGRYRATLAATDAAGNRSARKRLAFKVRRH